MYLYNFVTAENYGDEPTVYVMEDASFQTNSESLSNDGEGNLDVQLALGLGMVLNSPLAIFYHSRLFFISVAYFVLSLYHPIYL